MSNSRDSIKNIWGERSPYHGEWPGRVDERTTEAAESWIQSACVLCSNGCGLEIGVKGGRIVGVRGRADDHVNRGRLGPKGLYGWEANNSKDRLIKPLIRKQGKLVPASWDEAMNLIVEKTKTIISQHSASAIGFYTSGQLFLEEYYTLAVIGKAGLGTPHMDGNTRLCTATAGQALKETFGTDGQPASYTDFDITDAILHVGHNVAEAQTVLWSKILDRRRGSKPPKLVVIDPRETATAKEADVHLAPILGTNVAVLNGLLNLIIENGQIDKPFINEHTVGFEFLRDTVALWSPERVEKVSAVPADKLRAAADILGSANSLVSSVLQGVYQSNQATAAAVQVNNLNLIRGLIGKPGCGVLQMNGQPTAQNTRESGANGDLPGFRNWDNPAHIDDLAKIWNVNPGIIPHWAPPTHAMQIFRYCEQGSIRMLWISATNPAVSLPDLPRIRQILQKKSLFVIAQDAFMTETTELADVVLPAAIWGEKTGCFTNADRTVHISRKAVEPPGESKSDLEIFLDYANRMDFRDKDGDPLIKWNDAEGAFEAWKICSQGRPCDYSGMSYEKLSSVSGIQWPCNDQFPDGCEHLYVGGKFNTDADYCEDYGHNLSTGAMRTPEQYKANNPKGRAFLHAADYEPPQESPDQDYPFWLTTGRVVYHFHTRTKTGRSRELNQAAPNVFVQVNETDAEALGLANGDIARLESRRGAVEAAVRVGGIRRGHIFVPFHYGYWDDDSQPRAANELTITEWDPVSKQPHFKFAAVQITKVGDNSGGTRKPAANVNEAVSKIKDASAGSNEAADSKKHVAEYLGLLKEGEQAIAEAFTSVANHHIDEPDIFATCQKLAHVSGVHAEAIERFTAIYGEVSEHEPSRVKNSLFQGPRSGAFGLVLDLHDLFLLTTEAHLGWMVLLQASQALRDKEFIAACTKLGGETDGQRAWLQTRIKQAVPQALLIDV
ncbi:MAG TPA: nitrate reductase [Pyrinomonadaceae bacterium]|nr:nitrate reductase [Pyrinomonadaceae bacterium]